MSSRYLVVKVEDIEKLKREVAKATTGYEQLEGIGLLEELDLEDAEVIRRQDITAAPIFYCYASLIRSYADIVTDPERAASLHDTADWAMNAAMLAEKHEAKKYPD